MQVRLDKAQNVSTTRVDITGDIPVISLETGRTLLFINVLVPNRSYDITLSVPEIDPDIPLEEVVQLISDKEVKQAIDRLLAHYDLQCDWDKTEKILSKVDENENPA